MLDKDIQERKRSLESVSEAEPSQNETSDIPNKRQAVKEERSIKESLKEADFIPLLQFNTSSEVDKKPGMICTSHENQDIIYHLINMRSIFTTKEAGVIIGKAGSNIAEIRERTGTKITITENIEGLTERVLACTGDVTSVSKAYNVALNSILQDSLSNRDSKTKLQNPRDLTPHSAVVRDTSTEVQLKLLISHKSMGLIIGRSGTKIREIQSLTNVRLFASEHLMPQSTERILFMAGTPEMCEDAIIEIGKILSSSPERGQNVVQYTPRPHYQPSATPYSYTPDYSAMYNQANTYGYGYGYNVPVSTTSGLHLISPLDPNINVGPQQAQQVLIPNDLIGRIIGKAGAKINEIRMVSQAQIKIAEKSEESHQRLVTIIGSAGSINLALNMLYKRLEEENPRV